MLQVVQESGVFGLLIVALVIVNLALVISSLASLLGSATETPPGLPNRVNSVLFWGAIGLLAGLLGQVTGLYLGSRAISVASEVSPNLVMEGLAISFLPTIMGLMFLLGSALAWWGLRYLCARRMPLQVSA